MAFIKPSAFALVAYSCLFNATLKSADFSNSFVVCRFCRNTVNIQFHSAFLDWVCDRYRGHNFYLAGRSNWTAAFGKVFQSFFYKHVFNLFGLPPV